MVGMMRLTQESDAEVLNIARGVHLGNAEDESYRKITKRMEEHLDG